MDVHSVEVSKKALKQLKSVPNYILDKFLSWVEAIELEGLSEIKKIPGFHDEPLKGKRKGQRSVRLSKAYRAIYRIEKETIVFVFVEEVNKHEY